MLPPLLYIFHSLNLCTKSFQNNSKSLSRKMKWGRRKTSNYSRSTSVFARVFSGSWLSKLRPKGGNYETDSVKNKHRSELGCPTRFYSLDEDDAYWRMSFAEERIQQGRRSTGGINPMWYDHPDHEFQALVMKLSRRDECLNFNDMVLDVKKMKERQNKKKIPTGNGDKYENFSDPCSRMLTPGVSFDKQMESEILPEDEEGRFPVSVSSSKSAVSTPTKQPDNITRFSLSPVEEHQVLEPPNEDGYGRFSFSEWHNTEDERIKEIKVTTDCLKKSAETKLYKKVKLKTHAPRAECKVGGAIEQMKKSRMKWKKERDTIFDSFAVVKTSSDPHRDFKDSMVEMIREEGIARPKELEDLLACYLTLNGDEYHDLIIKVFKEVWLEMNEGCISSSNGEWSMFRKMNL